MRPHARRWLGAGLIAALGLLTYPTTQAQDAPAKEAPKVDQAAVDAAIAADQKIISEIRNHAEILKNLRYLSDVIGPRLTGSPSLKKANDWTLERMKDYGLTSTHLEAWEIPAGWERGPVTMKLVEPQAGRVLTAAARAWTPGTNGKVVGDVVILNARSKADLEKYKGKLKNAIVLSSPPSPVPTLPELLTQRERTGPARKGPDAAPKKDGEPKEEAKKDEPKKDEPKKEEAKKDEAKKDAPPARPGFGADMMNFRRELSEFLKAEGVAVMLTDSAKPLGLLNMTGNWPAGDRAAAAGNPLPSLFVTHDHYALLYRLASRENAVTRVEVEIDSKFVPGPLPVYNTVGEIKGSEKPDEFVVVGAHLDSWDLASGTTDNGTGSSIVMEAARAIVKSGVVPKRTIRFVLFTGEEQGLYGSKAYVAKHKDEMPKTSCILVHDTGTGKVTGFGLEARTSVKKILDPESVSLKALPGFTEHSLKRQGGTDNVSFEAVGVPGFAADQDMTTYYLTHHSQADTFDAALEPELIEGAQVMAVMAVRIANLPELLPRDKPEPKGGGRRGRPMPETAPAPTPVPEKKPVAHRLIAADKGMVRIVDAAGKTEWETETKSDCHDLALLPNGNVLFPYTSRKLVEVNPDKKVVWSYEAKPTAGSKGVEIHAFQRLADGTTMIAESGNCRIIEVNAEGKIVKEFPLDVKNKAVHTDTRMVRKLADGDYLVCHEADGMVKEYSPEGKVVWSYAMELGDRKASPGHGPEGHGTKVFGAVRLPNGNTLIAGGNNNRVLEVTPKGEIVWKIDQDELPGIKLAWVTSLHYLPNGNVVVGNCHAGPDNPQLFEVTRDKKVVWTFKDHERFGNGLAMAEILDEPKAIR